MIFTDESQTTISSHLPRWFNEISGIFEKEQVGAILGLLGACILAILAPGRHVLLFCDNLGTVATLRRGSSVSPLGRQLASVFWAISASHGCAVWIESVLSGLNAAGPPSRFCSLTPKPAVGTADRGPPESFLEISQDRMALLQSQYGFRKDSDGCGTPMPCDNTFEEPCLKKIATDKNKNILATEIAQSA